MMIKLLLSILLATTLMADSLKVAVASNVRFAFKEIAKVYEQKSGIKIVPIISSSGKLTAQIQHGAPFHLFLSADMKFPNYLYERGLTVSKAKIYAYGTLVLWSLNEKIDVSIEGLKDENIRRIAIANPRVAPYGVQGLKVLEKHGIKELLYSKIAFGESVSQVNKFIFSRAADIGITAKSVVLSPRMEGVGRWKEISKYDYSPIEQGIVILSYGKKNKPKKSLDFFNFMFSKDAQKILQRYGYIVP